MKPYILTIDEGYGEFVYSVYAESFPDAYEKVKNDKELVEELILVKHSDLLINENKVTFTAEKYGSKVNCAITELKEHEGVLCLGGYAE